MVSEFLENGGSSGADSLCSSDSESGLSDLHHLADKISFYRHSGAQYESDLLSLVHSLMVSIKETDFACQVRWQGGGKVPGGDHEYVDVVNYNCGSSERLIIDIDFQSHFEIARAVDSYDRILKSLPVIYLGSMTRLKQYLQVMVEAAKSSQAKLNALPPWRSLAYLQAKWQSPYERHWSPEEQILAALTLQTISSAADI
ncbi:hypothetical protein GH714_035958 [Hevea brasiliensis]|uniref:Uncharacterized protein n=1 Tax=Hevea brasiliensis TaxID=3981 RepID=A0A6A6L7M2_HEVBR|nr:hypothetical protein GH714_035958 [Hevea brasiliensis]